MDVKAANGAPPEPMHGHLLHNLVLFGRLLRALGMDVNPGRMIDLVEAFQHIQIGRRSDFYHACRSLLVHDRDDIPLFDRAFELFWRRRADSLSWQIIPPAREEKQPPITMVPYGNPPPDPPAAEDGLDEDDQLVIEVTRTYSRREQLREKDFSKLTEAEFNELQKFMAALVWQLGQRRTRRFQPGLGNSADLRRAFRRNMRYGGEILEWPAKEPKIKMRPLVIIADISGSMERYTRMLLHFIYSIKNRLEQPVEAFVFSTRLTRITRQLRTKNVEQALSDVSANVHDWGGGTRIGEAIKDFNYNWGRRVLGRGAVVLLISDGWDRGDPALLHTEMQRLQRSCYRLIWLNPLLGSDKYEPLTRGMVAALPCIDDFLPVHNLASLEDLAEHLADLSGNRRSPRKARFLPGAAFSK